MKAVTYNQFGNPKEVVECRELPQPEPKPDEVLVRMALSPIHNHDVLTIRGEYGNRPTLPATGGTEALGAVEAVGEKVSNRQVGDRVVIARAAGAWAEYFTAPAQAVIVMDKDVPDELATQMSSMPFSAVMALNELRAQSGDWVAVNAGNGAVGKLIAQVARERGVHTISIVRSTKSKHALLQLGFPHVFATDDHDWIEQARRALGNGRIVGGVDMVGGEAAGELLSLLCDGGVMLSFGAMGDSRLKLDVADLIYKETTVRGFWATRVVERLGSAELGAIAAELLGLAAAGKLYLPVAAIFSLDQAREAMAEYEENREGKLLFKP